MNPGGHKVKKKEEKKGGTLEGVVGSLLSVLIRVELEGHLAVRLLDILTGGLFLNLEHLVICLTSHHGLDLGRILLLLRR